MAIRFSYRESDIEIYFDHAFISNEDFLFEGQKFKDELGRKVTKVTIFVDKEQTVEGVSICKPPDNFSKSTGRKLAIKDALYKIKEKDLRKAIWNNYREKCK